MNLAYERFAAVYDTLMEQVPYPQWCAYVHKLFLSAGVQDGLVLDLGCGTGTATLLFSRMGYDMIGIDASQEMLMQAREKLQTADAHAAEANAGRDVLLLEQDMRRFELYGTVRAVVSMCDTLNYCESEAELLQVFRLVNNYLDPGGLFVFDVNTLFKYRHVLGDRVFAATEADCAYIWENNWFEEEMVNQYDLTLFIREEATAHYLRSHELHTQRAFSDETVRRLLEQAGLILERAEDAYTGRPLTKESERALYVARESGKSRVVS